MAVRKSILPITTLLISMLTTPLVAQQGALGGVDSLIAAGNYTEARAALAEWWKNPDRGGEARALFLRARLNTDPALAQEDYLALILGHPDADERAAALLYLGQGLFAAGDHYRAITYLERLVRDYPSSQFPPTALLWLARVQMSASQPNAACATARQGSASNRNPDLTALMKAEEADACAASARGGVDKPLSPLASARGEESPTPAELRGGGTAERGTATPANGPFALQAGAFREATGAAALSGHLKRAGFEPRIVLVPGSNLRRVRIGSFPTAAEANAMAGKIRAAGFEIVVVSDAATERENP
jgi:tetratricopeptide (TPR) repeat protein